MPNELQSTTPSALDISTGTPVSFVQQTGEKNVYANHVETMNIIVQEKIIDSSTTKNQSVCQDSYFWGSVPISFEDYQLLDDFKNDYARIMEYCINTDFASELVDINFSDNVTILYKDKWRFKSKDFKSSDLRKLKNKILKTLNELTYYVSPEFLRYHEASGMLIFKNQSWEEGCRLRDDFQPNSLRLRQTIADLYVELYPDEFADENV